MSQTKNKLLNMKTNFLPESGVLIVEPFGPLNTKDFDNIETVVDPWIKKNGPLLGLVIHARTFPGWSGFSALVRHLRFIRAHHRGIRRIALAVDGTLPSVVSRIFAHFVQAEIRIFGYGRYPQALAWATELEQKPKVGPRFRPDEERMIPNIPGF